MNAPASRIPLTPTRADIDDEIDLFELMAIVWAGRWLCITLITLAVVLAAVYINLTPKTYKVDTVLHPINDMQLALISPGFSEHKENHNVGELNALNLYNTALNNLRNESAVEKFLLKTDTRAQTPDLTQNINAFLKALTVSRDKDSTRATISLSGTQPQETAARLQSYLVFASSEAMASVSKDMLAAIDANIQYLDQSMQQARQRAEKQITDKAAILSEAIGIAKALDIKESRLDRLANMEVTLFNDKLYLFGTRALQAELAALMKRRHNDAFVPELRELESAKGALLIDAEKIRQNLPDIQAFTVPASLHAPVNPHSPKAPLIMLLAIGMGTIAGLFAIFFRQGIRSYKNRHRPDPMADYKKAILRREGNYAVV